MVNTANADGGSGADPNVRDSFTAGNDNLTEQYQVELLSFMLALSGVESGGSDNPTTAASVMNSGGRGTAKGIFQFLDTTWVGAAKPLGIKAPRASEASAEEQWAVAANLMTNYFKKYNDWGLVATAWFAGPDRARRLSEGDESVRKFADAYGTTVEQYMSKVTKNMKGHLQSGVQLGDGLFERAIQGAQKANFASNTPLDGVSSTGQITSQFSAVDGDNRILTQTTDTVARKGDDGQTIAGTSGDFSLADTDQSGDVDNEEVRAYIENNFSQVSWALDHPELGSILREAAENDWDKARIYGKLIQTDWWKENPQSARVLENLKNNDPATWQEMVRQRSASIKDSADTIGWASTPEAIGSLAEQSLMESWSDVEIRQNITSSLDIDMEALSQGKVGGEVASTYSRINALSGNFLVSLSNKEKSDWLKQIVSGTANLSSFEQYLGQVASAQFPWAQDALDRGIKPDTYIRPYQNWVAQTLEIGADQVDVAGKYKDAVYDSESGKLRTLPEVETFVKSTFSEDWRKTKQAHQQYASLGENLAKMFGKVG